MQTSAKKFVTEKLAERDQRHAKSGESRYAVEPDIKDGKGGLRDLHTLFWIAKFLFEANSPEELAEKGAFSREELKRFQKCEDFLWAVRCHLHFIAKRGEDKISFDRQSELAERLGLQGPCRPEACRTLHEALFSDGQGSGRSHAHFLRLTGGPAFEGCATRCARVISRFFPRGRRQIMRARGFPHRKSGGISIAVHEMFHDDPVNLIRIFKSHRTRTPKSIPMPCKLIRTLLAAH